MGDLYEMRAEPDLSEPVLVVGLDGWIDAGFAAAAAVAHLDQLLDPKLVAAFDTEVLVDHRSRRPIMHLENGVNTGLTWPTIELHHGRDRAGHDVLLLTGAEPDLHWRAFSTEVVALAAEMGVRLTVGLGAYPAPMPHTRDSRLATTATTEELASLVGQVRATLDVPAGVMAAIERACAEADRPAVGLWAQVPHYASGMAYPSSSALLIDGLARLCGLELDTTSLHQAGQAMRQRLDQLVAANEDHVRMVQALESAYDDELAGPHPGTNLPSGDELAAEFEAFLRQQDQGGSSL